MAYEDVTLTTSDSVKIKAYVIPARQNVKSREAMMGLSSAERDELGKQAMDDWVQEMGQDDAIEVRPWPSFPGQVSRGRANMGRDQFAKSRPTVVIFHANAGMCSL